MSQSTLKNFLGTETSAAELVVREGQTKALYWLLALITNISQTLFKL